MKKNNLKNILEAKDWTIYRLWQELGGEVGDRRLVYELAGHEFIPERTTLKTLHRIAASLDVSIDDLYTDVAEAAA
jgi:hypothetical protein